VGTIGLQLSQYVIFLWLRQKQWRLFCFCGKSNCYLQSYNTTKPLDEFSFAS